jgi:hypothetical protein
MTLPLTLECVAPTARDAAIASLPTGSKAFLQFRVAQEQATIRKGRQELLARKSGLERKIRHAHEPRSTGHGLLLGKDGCLITSGHGWAGEEKVLARC